MESILLFENFGFQYNAQTSPTLFDINFSVRKGEKILIAGPSGCGKSTLVHCINGLIPFSYKGEMTGSLKLFGKETSELSIFDISMHVGTVLQDSDAQFVGLTVAEDIAFSLENDCVTEPALHDKVFNAAKMVDIENFLDHAPSQLSGGQKQRVSLAGVLAGDVDILLFDEPLANLDPATGKQAMELIDDLQKRTGAAVIIVEHRLEDVLHRDVDRVVLMEKGRIVCDLSPDELLSGDYLKNAGVREPLYITAMKYADIKVSPDMLPHSIRTVKIQDDEAAKIRKWFETADFERKASNEDVLLETRNLVFSYDKKRNALDDISVTIRKGEMVAIVGTNGAGKSTFSKVVCGFEDKDLGEIIFDGKDFSLCSIKERADSVGYVMQNPNQMISKVMIFDEVALGLRTRGVDEKVIKEKVEETLKICGLWQFRNWPISALSYGQKKRVTIASILVLSPSMIILDEPTAGQDYRHYTEIMEFLSMINKRGITVVMITHDMHLMLEYADRAIVFSGGKVIADDSCAEILTNAEVIEKASLKETSLYELAGLARIEQKTEFVSRFISFEREVARHE